MAQQSADRQGPGRTRSWSDRIEETLIAVILGVMTLITFVNVLARKSFDFAHWISKTFDVGVPEFLSGNILWAVEATVFLFAWMVLLGTSYCVKHTAHLGVDVLINVVSPQLRRLMGFISLGACLLFAFFLCKGAWDYWSIFANLPPTTGRWVPTGFVDSFRGQGWYETKDVPLPFFLTWMEQVFNEGYEYEKMPRLLPYAILPISMALLMFRFVQAGIRMVRGDQDRLIVSHEVEDQIDAAAEKVGA